MVIKFTDPRFIRSYIDAHENITILINVFEIQLHSSFNVEITHFNIIYSNTLVRNRSGTFLFTAEKLRKNITLLK